MISYLAEKSEQLETAIVDLQLWGAGEAAHAIGEVVEEIEEVLRHDVERAMVAAQ